MILRDSLGYTVNQEPMSIFLFRIPSAGILMCGSFSILYVLPILVISYILPTENVYNTMTENSNYLVQPFLRNINFMCNSLLQHFKLDKFKTLLLIFSFTKPAPVYLPSFCFVVLRIKQNLMNTRCALYHCSTTQAISLIALQPVFGNNSNTPELFKPKTL